tara:strand:- start:13073 stop:13642 length:570 start_codon:yes stop_codon:yes gene_type:complete
MRTPRHKKQLKTSNSQSIEHDIVDDNFQDPADFLDRHHPENDQYMKSIEHVQSKIMFLTTMLREKQINILKSVFSGENYTQAGKRHGSVAATVSKLVKSHYGQQLLNMLQYHRQLVEGPNEALRRNMLFRIAQNAEEYDPRTSIKAIGELNKMHHQSQLLANPNAGGQQTIPAITININQELMPKGALD